jgi:hypothetical protein
MVDRCQWKVNMVDRCQWKRCCQVSLERRQNDFEQVSVEMRQYDFPNHTENHTTSSPLTPDNAFSNDTGQEFPMGSSLFSGKQ